MFNIAMQPAITSPQRILNGEVHNWYRIVLGYSDHLVSNLLHEFRLGIGHRVLDPFCGTGTTMVECLKHGIDCTGIDANPSSCLAARVKTDWNLSPEHLAELADEVARRRPMHMRRTKAYRNDPAYAYLETSGMIERGWISEQPLREALAIKASIQEIRTSNRYREALTLALLSTVVAEASNVKFGPEIYCTAPRLHFHVFESFKERIQVMLEDITIIEGLKRGQCHVICGDSRDLSSLLKKRVAYDCIICSPPYPAEHDYTRNSRLELAFLGLVDNNDDVRAIKRSMIRCHTKGLYSDDNDRHHIKCVKAIRALADQLAHRARGRTDGFAQRYSVVVQEYFGGMYRHLVSVRTRLKSKAMCAYVVGDQAPYLQVHIPTARILSSLARDAGFEVLEIRRWRSRRSTVTARLIEENILVLRNKE